MWDCVQFSMHKVKSHINVKQISGAQKCYKEPALLNGSYSPANCSLFVDKKIYNCVCLCVYKGNKLEKMCVYTQLFMFKKNKIIK